MNTLQQYEDFRGTENYYEFEDGYAYTDAINWLKTQLPEQMFYILLVYITNKMSYKLPFGFFSLHITDDPIGEIYVITTDGDGNTLNKYILCFKKDLPDFKLDNGIYRIWCQNYVIFGASEY